MKSKHVEEGLVIKHVPTGKYLDDEGELVNLDEAEEYFISSETDALSELIQSYLESGHYAPGALIAVKVRTTKEEV